MFNILLLEANVFKNLNAQKKIILLQNCLPKIELFANF